MCVLGIFLSIGIIYGLGFFLETLIFGRRRKTSFYEVLYLGYGLGTGVLAFGSLLLARLGVSLTRNVYLIFFFPLALVGFFILIKIRISSKDVSQSADKFQRFNLWEWAFLLIILLSVMVIAANALIGPLTSWDARAIWGLKGKFIYYEKTMYSPSFLDPEYVHLHSEYPLLIPFLESFFSAIIENWNEGAIKIIFLLFYVSLIFAVYSAQRKIFPRFHSLMFTSMLALLACYQKYAGSGDVDVPLSFYYTIGAIYLLAWMRQGGIRRLLVSSLFIGFGVFTKNEGLALAGILAFVLIIFCLLSLKNMSKSRWLAVLVFLAFLGIIVTPWFLTRHILPKRFDEDYPSRVRLRIIREGSGRVPEILNRILREFLRLENWGLFWPLGLLSVILACKVKLKRPEKYLLLILGLHISLYIFIYMITPWPLQELMKITLSRLLMHLVPLCLILFSGLFFKAWQSICIGPRNQYDRAIIFWRFGRWAREKMRNLVWLLNKA